MSLPSIMKACHPFLPFLHSSLTPHVLVLRREGATSGHRLRGQGPSLAPKIHVSLEGPKFSVGSAHQAPCCGAGVDASWPFGV